MQKPLYFLQTNNKQVYLKLKHNTILLCFISTHKNEILGIKLTKGVWDLYEENYKTH